MPAETPTMNGVQFLRGTKFLSAGDFANHVLTQFTRAENGEKEEIKNGDGQTITVVYFNNKITFTFTILIKTTGAYTVPARGAAITPDPLPPVVAPKPRRYTTAGVAEWEVTTEYFPSLGATD